jgi:hypothetical protein
MPKTKRGKCRPTDEEDDVGVVQFGEERHLGAEFQQSPLVQVLFDETLDRHVHSLPLALVHHAVRSHPDLPHK